MDEKPIVIHQGLYCPRMEGPSNHLPDFTRVERATWAERAIRGYVWSRTILVTPGIELVVVDFKETPEEMIFMCERRGHVLGQKITPPSNYIEYCNKKAQADFEALLDKGWIPSDEMKKRFA